MSFKNVVVAGGGVLGSQIAYQSAFRGFHVTIWLRSEASIGRAKPKIDRLHSIYLDTLDACSKNPALTPRGFCEDPSKLTPEQFDKMKKAAEAAYNNMIYETDLATAVADADLVIEAMAENPADKIAFYQKLAPVLKEKTILATNSSTLLPSTFAEYTGRPEKYLALHFANEIWKNNTAEIMGHPGT